MRAFNFFVGGFCLAGALHSAADGRTTFALVLLILALLNLLLGFAIKELVA